MTGNDYYKIANEDELQEVTKRDINTQSTGVMSIKTAQKRTCSS